MIDITQLTKDKESNQDDINSLQFALQQGLTKDEYQSVVEHCLRTGESIGLEVLIYNGEGGIGHTNKHKEN